MSFSEAARECKNVLDAVESNFQDGIPEELVDNRLQEFISEAVELLPEIWKQAGFSHEVIPAYRRALLGQWSLSIECCSRVEKKFAVFLLYSGIEALAPSLTVQTESSYTPGNNLEEAILLLMILLRKCCLGKVKWDLSILERLTFALSLCSETTVLARQFEEILPGVFNHVDRWNTLALCHAAAGEDKDALNLLRKSLHKYERPDELMPLLLAAKICSRDPSNAAEGMRYAERAVTVAHSRDEHMKSIGLHMMGRCLRKQAKMSFSDSERSHLQSEALKLLERSFVICRNNTDLIFELGVLNAELRNLDAALHYAKQFIVPTGGSMLEGWKLLALVLSAQQRFSEALVVIDAALDETAKWDQGPLLRMKAKLKMVQSLPRDANEAYRHLLALVQAQKRYGLPQKGFHLSKDDSVSEFDVWHSLATMYSVLSRWKDAEICLKKARMLKQYSADVLQTKGMLYESQGLLKEALASYVDAVSLDPDNISSKLCLSALLSKMGSKTLPVAIGLLSDALRIEATNHKAWYCLGMIHRSSGRYVDAMECFQAAVMLKDFDPVERFSSTSFN
ncbi:hypothetical protein Droror1_Dr00002858 [Drosera rotundifolia]